MRMVFSAALVLVDDLLTVSLSELGVTIGAETRWHGFMGTYQGIFKGFNWSGRISDGSKTPSYMKSGASEAAEELELEGSVLLILAVSDIGNQVHGLDN